MARPKIEIDPDKVESLAGINCTVEEIATVLECSKDTLERRFAANIKRGREQGRSSLRRMMWEKAKSGNVTMMIWLSKQLLGYTDKIVQDTHAHLIQQAKEMASFSTEQLIKIVNQAKEKLPEVKSEDS